MYLDNANFWIEAKKFFGKTLNNQFYNEDPRIRIDPKKLTDTILGTRIVEGAFLYGSGI
jgi:hypothetical protein